MWRALSDRPQILMHLSSRKDERGRREVASRKETRRQRTCSRRNPSYAQSLEGNRESGAREVPRVLCISLTGHAGAQRLNRAESGRRWFGSIHLSLGWSSLDSYMLPDMAKVSATPAYSGKVWIGILRSGPPLLAQKSLLSLTKRELF
jgi:hypothetical protein